MPLKSDIVFTCDRQMLPGLHVALTSVLEYWNDASGEIQFHIYSTDLTEVDLGLLKKSLDRVNKPYFLELHIIDESPFEGYPQLNGSYATYHRLLIPQLIDSERYLYLDTDTLCKIDLSPLFNIDMRDSPIAMVPEAPINHCIDSQVASLLKTNAVGKYFNGGVAMVNTSLWQNNNLTAACLNFVSKHSPAFHDQSAVNFVLHQQIHELDPCYNLRTNAREFWPRLRRPNYGEGNLLHFVDYPKPWSAGGRWLHPLGKIWQEAFLKTELGATQTIPSRTRLNWITSPKYRKSAKDTLLYKLYSAGILHRVKGMS